MDTSENKPFEFKVGDRVKCAYFGDEVFELASTITPSYPLEIRTDGKQCTFTVHGKSYASHTHPVLTLVERPKRKEKRTITLYINIYPSGYGDRVHDSKREADRNAGYNRIDCIEFTHEYEVEAEE